MEKCINLLNLIRNMETNQNEPCKYAIAWQENTNTTKYHNELEPNGTRFIEGATLYNTEKEAKEIITNNNWYNCYITPYN